MPKKRRQQIKINNNESLESLCQETYNDACLQIIDTQKTINELVTSAPKELDVDGLTKVAKEKGGLLKIRDSAIRIKLDLAKLQHDIIKNTGDNSKKEDNEKSQNGAASLDDFKKVRELLNKSKNKVSDLDENSEEEL